MEGPGIGHEVEWRHKLLGFGKLEHWQVGGGLGVGRGVRVVSSCVKRAACPGILPVGQCMKS